MPSWPTPEHPARSISGALREASDRIGERSPSARLDAEVLLAHVLGKSRTFLRAWADTRLDPDQLRAYSSLIERRRDGTPVAYLTGFREFWSREFLVTPDVLIPRPETELLVEIALAYLREHPSATVLDLATGSGAIAVTLAVECPAASVYAADVSPAALAVARHNAQRHAVPVRFLQSDWFAALSRDLAFDLIVSNPPYIPDTDPHLGEGDVRFEPRLALAAGPDGLDAYRIIADQVQTWLKPGGSLLLEHGYDQALPVRALLEQARFQKISLHADLSGHARAILATDLPS